MATHDLTVIDDIIPSITVLPAAFIAHLHYWQKLGFFYFRELFTARSKTYTRWPIAR